MDKKTAKKICRWIDEYSPLFIFLGFLMITSFIFAFLFTSITNPFSHYLILIVLFLISISIILNIIQHILMIKFKLEFYEF